MRIIWTMVCLLASGASAAQDARFTRIFDKDHPSDFRPAFSDRAAWEKRAEFLRTQVLVSQGLWPMPEKSPLNAVVYGAIKRDGYTVEKVFFASMAGHYVTGNLYRPTGRTGKLPAVLCPYGHWPNGRFMWTNDEGIKKAIDSGAEITADAARSPLQAGCAMLARSGCIVFHYDMVGYGDSTALKHREGFADAESILRLQSIMGLQTWNSIRAVDFVRSLPEVDPDRIGVTGASGGGTQTLMLAAVDPRIAADFPVVMVSMNMQGGCVCENAPLLRVGTNNVELAALFAPYPQGMAAAQDWTHDFETRGLPELKSIYRLFGAEGDVEGRFFPFPHNDNLHSRELMYDFFNRKLKLGLAAPVKEEPFVPVPPAELSVYGAEHLMPADAADVTTLRRKMTQTSDAQIAALRENLPEYRRTVRAALKAMVVDEMPAAGDVEIVEGSQLPPFSGGGEWGGVISRAGCGERVPCRAIVPKKWGGEIVVWAHPEGCASVTSGDRQFIPAVAQLLDHGIAVVALDQFMSRRFVPGESAATQRNATTRSDKLAYAGFVLGYNRSVFANRVHDLLSVIVLARGWSKAPSVHLIGFKDAGPVALLARAIAQHAVDRAVIDLDQFDFDRITDDSDPMLLPGALKYGGIYGFLPLCDRGESLFYNARDSKHSALAASARGVVLTRERIDVGSMIAKLLP